MWTATKSRTNAHAADASTAIPTHRPWANFTAPLASLDLTKRRALGLIRDGVNIATTLTVLTVLSAGAVVWIVAGPGSPLRTRKSAKEKA
jgi:hypothetical protein